MENHKTGKFVSVIVWILIVLFLLGVVGIIFLFTNGGNEDFKTFYLVYDGKMILSADSRMELDVGKEHRFDVKYTFDVGREEPLDYSVKIAANTDVSFDFTVDGEQYNWRGEKDVTDVFDLVKEETHFTLNLPAEMTLKTVLGNLHEGTAGELDETLMDTLKEEYLFTLVVSSYNEKVTYRIGFRIPIRLDCNVTLDRSSILF